MLITRGWNNVNCAWKKKSYIKGFPNPNHLKKKSELVSKCCYEAKHF